MRGQQPVDARANDPFDDSPGKPGQALSDAGKAEALRRKIASLTETLTNYYAYAEIYDRVGVRGADREALRDLMVAKEAAIQLALQEWAKKYAVNIYGRPQSATHYLPEGRGEYDVIRAAIAGPLDAQIRALLGDERFGNFRESGNRVYYYGKVSALDNELERTQAPPLSPAQKESLLSALAVANPAPDAYSSVRLTDTIVADATVYLDPGQQAALRKLSADQQTVDVLRTLGLAVWEAGGRVGNEIRLDALPQN